jgi:catalase (peroxidase I)
VYEDRATGEVRRTGTAVDPVFGSRMLAFAFVWRVEEALVGDARMARALGIPPSTAA